MITKTLNVNEETCSYMERLGREIDGSRDIIVFMIENDKNTKTDTFKQYKAEYEEAYAAYNIAKQEIQDKYIPKALIEADGNNVSWTLDYASGEMLIEYKGKMSEDMFNNYFN